MIELAKNQCWKELENNYPGDWIRMGQRLKALYWIQEPAIQKNQAEHLWIHGPPGTGKSNIVEVLFPGYYYKRPDRDWTGYCNQSVVYIGDIDPPSFQKIGMTNLKVWADRQGFNADRKYAGGEHIVIGQLIVTSNFKIQQCMQHDLQGYGPILAALRRRFKEITVDKLLDEYAIRLRPKYQLEYLLSIGNLDYSKCFQYVDNQRKVHLTPFEMPQGFVPEWDIVSNELEWISNNIDIV